MSHLIKIAAFFLLSLPASAELLPLFTEINLPDGRKENLQVAVDQIRELAFQFSDAINQGEHFAVNNLIEEYQKTLVQLNPEIAGNLPSSIYKGVLEQSHSFIISRATKSYRDTFLFLIYHAENWGAELPQELPKWNDDIIVHSVSFEAETLKFTAYNIDKEIHQLHDKNRAFDVILNILHVYQFRYYYVDDKLSLGNKFSQLLKDLTYNYSLDKDRENKILQLSYTMKDPKILAWYKTAKIQLNVPLQRGPSLFCFNTLGMLSQYKDDSSSITKENIKDRVRQFLNFGASFKASCGTQRLDTQLIDLKNQHRSLEIIIEELLSLSEDFSSSSRKIHLNQI